MCLCDIIRWWRGQSMMSSTSQRWRESCRGRSSQRRDTRERMKRNWEPSARESPTASSGNSRVLETPQGVLEEFQEALKRGGVSSPFTKHSRVRDLELIPRSLRELQESFKILQGSLREFQALSYMCLCLSEIWSCPATWGLWRRKIKMELHGDSPGTPLPRATIDVWSPRATWNTSTVFLYLTLLLWFE